MINKLADDYHTVMSWNGLDITSKWSRLARKRIKNDDIDATSAMKRLLHSDQSIKEWIAERLDDIANEEDNDADE